MTDPAITGTFFTTEQIAFITDWAGSHGYKAEIDPDAEGPDQRVWICTENHLTFWGLHVDGTTGETVCEHVDHIEAVARGNLAAVLTELGTLLLQDGHPKQHMSMVDHGEAGEFDGQGN
jgi:hypothetical protein